MIRKDTKGGRESKSMETSEKKSEHKYINKRGGKRESKSRRNERNEERQKGASRKERKLSVPKKGKGLAAGLNSAEHCTGTVPRDAP